MSENPYAPPVAGSPPEPGDHQRPALREIVVGWEKLRLWYNAILLVPGMAVFWVWVSEYGMPFGLGMVFAVMVAIAANFCFLLGPAAELYLRGLFMQGRPLGRGRLLLFAAGMLVSFGVFAVASVTFW